VVGLDSFGKPDTLPRVFKKLVQSYALDAIDFLEPDKEIKVSKTGVSDLIQSARPACGIKDRRYIDEVLREFIHKIFSNRKNFIWMTRWSTCRFLTGPRMSRRDKDLPGWGAFRTGGGTVSKTTATIQENTEERELGNPD